MTAVGALEEEAIQEEVMVVVGAADVEYSGSCGFLPWSRI